MNVTKGDMKIRKVVAIFAIWLVVVNVFGVIALNRLNLSGDTAYGWIDPTSFVQERSWDPVAMHSRWDSVWYLDIAKDGYSFNGPGKLSNIVFFPLYPALIKVVTPFTGGSPVLAGWILSSAFLLLALVYLSKLVREFHKTADPELAIAFLLLFPTAFFLNAVYTESLFLFLSIATFYYALKKTFILAAAIGFLASLTRLTGALLVIPLVFEVWRTYRGSRRFDWRALSVLSVPLGTIGFFLFHRIRFGDFFLFFKVESWWGRTFGLNTEHLELLTRPAIVNFALDASFAVFAIVATYLVFRRLRASYGLYMAATVAVALSTGTLMSIGRYVLVLFPIPILLASTKDRNLQFGYALTCTLLLALYTALFVNGYWTG